MRPIGIVDGAPAYNPGNYTQLSPGNFDTGEAQMGGQIVLHNVSPYDLLVWFDDQVQAQYTLHAWQPRQWNFCGVQRRNIYFYPAFTPPADMVNNAPASYLWGESYQTGEDVPQFFPADARINAVGNTISTKGTSNVLNNDGNAPGTQVVEMTPSDQASSSVQEYNDASGFHKILSAGVLRSIWNFIRGDSGATKAVLTLGDSTDTSILTVYATLGSGSVVPVGVIAAGTLPAGVLIPGGQVSSAVNQALQIKASGSAGIGGYWDSTNRIAHLRQAGFSGNVAVAIDGYNSTGGIFNEGFIVNPDGSVGLALNLFQIDATGTVIAGSVPAGVIAPGALPSGVTIPGAQVTGSVASATNATTAGALAAGGALEGNATIPRGDFLEDASDAATQIGVAGDGAAEVISQNHEALLSSDVFTRVRYNVARAAGGGDTYMDSTNPAIDWFLHPDHEHWWQHRFAAAGAAGSAITWTSSGFTAIQIGISGSATATVSHGLNFPPWVALVNTFNGSNSTTFGSGSYSSSSVFIFEFNAQSWRGMVIA